MIDGFHIIPVWIEDEGRVVARMILRALARTAVVRPAGFEAYLVESLDCFAIAGLKSKVRSSGRLTRRGRTVRGRNDEFVGPEESRSFASERDAQDAENSLVKAPAALQIRHNQL